MSPPWYFSAPYMWITLLPGPVALWSLLAGAGLFVMYPFVDRELSRRGWPMPTINAILGALLVLGVAVLMVLDTVM